MLVAVFGGTMQIRKTYYHENQQFGKLAKYETEDYVIKMFTEITGETNATVRPKNTVDLPEIDFYNDKTGYISFNRVFDLKVGQIDLFIQKMKDVKELVEYIEEKFDSLKNGNI